MWKWTKRIALTLVAALVASGTVAGIMFANWRSEAIALRENDPDRRVAETPLGPVEYTTLGEGLPVLAIHGTPGGYDQSVAVQRAIPERINPEVMLIAASRPGYLGTPLASGESFAEQADLLAALLDELEIDRAVVFGASGGGFTALQFALRHPERTLGLLLYAPDTAAAPAGSPDPREMEPLAPWRMHMIEFGMWLVSGPLASTIVRDFDADDPIQMRSWNAMLQTAMPWDEHVAGQTNDVIQRLDPEIDNWPVERIATPTLIIHGDADANVDHAHSVRLAERLPDAELVTFEGGDHFVMVSHWQEVGALMQQFFGRFLEAQTIGP